MDVRRFLKRKTALRLSGELALAASCLALAALAARSARVSADVVAARPGLDEGEELLASQDEADSAAAEGMSAEGRRELQKLIESSNPKRIDRKPGILAPPIMAPAGGKIGAPYGKKELSQGEAPANGHYLDYSDEIPEQPPEPGER